MNPLNDSPDDGRVPPDRSGRARAALYFLAILALAVVGAVSIDEVQPPAVRETAAAGPLTKPVPKRASIAAARPVRSPARPAAKPTLPAARDESLLDGVRGEQLRDAVGTFELLKPGDDKLPNTTIIESTEADTASASRGRAPWSGPYAGVNLGGAVGISTMRTSIVSPPAYFLATDIAQINGLGEMNGSPGGFVGGVQAGYNRQAGALVYGLEADMNALQLQDKESVTAAFNSGAANSFTVSQSIRTDWLVTVRPRVGIAIGDVLLYGTGGVALTRFKYTEEYSDNFHTPSGGFGSESLSKTRLGWTLGAGGELALLEHWSLKGEYLYADFGRISGNSALAIPVVGGGDRFEHSATFSVHLVRLGLNYRF